MPHGITGDCPPSPWNAHQCLRSFRTTTETLNARPDSGNAVDSSHAKKEETRPRPRPPQRRLALCGPPGSGARVLTPALPTHRLASVLLHELASNSASSPARRVHRPPGGSPTQPPRVRPDRNVRPLGWSANPALRGRRPAAPTARHSPLAGPGTRPRPGRPVAFPWTPRRRQANDPRCCANRWAWLPCPPSHSPLRYPPATLRRPSPRRPGSTPVPSRPTAPNHHPRSGPCLPHARGWGWRQSGTATDRLTTTTGKRLGGPFRGPALLTRAPRPPWTATDPLLVEGRSRLSTRTHGPYVVRAASSRTADLALPAASPHPSVVRQPSPPPTKRRRRLKVPLAPGPPAGARTCRGPHSLLFSTLRY